MKYLRLEVKVCEGCGALWLRRAGIDGVYCTACDAHLSSFPVPAGKRPGGRPRLPRANGCASGRRPKAGAQ